VRIDLENLRRRAEEGNRRGFGGFQHPGNFQEGGPFFQRPPFHDEEYNDDWHEEHDFPPHGGHWGMHEEPGMGGYHDKDEDEDFGTWESDEDESDPFAGSAHRQPYGNRRQKPPHRFGEGSRNDGSPRPRSHTRRSRSQQNSHKPEDWKKAFDAYDGKWKNISATDASVPYPTTDLTPAPLHDRSRAEAITSIPLSSEKIIELNATSFFLWAFNLRPHITKNNAINTLIMSIPRNADIEQVKALRKQMKIERTRWHPDSLVKRRTGGEVKELEAKSIYTAIDELFEACKERLGEQ